MAINWAILDIDRNPKAHVISVVFQETTEDLKKFDYRITLPTGSTKAQYLAELKKQVLAARALRAKVETLRAAIDPAAIEAFINS